MDAPQEIEAKFLAVNHDEIRTRLLEVGAVLEHPMRLMRRDMLDYADHRYMNSHQTEKLRIRDEGDKVTATYKREKPDSDYPYEVEATVGSYTEIKQLFEAIGLASYSYQESKRETWHLDDVEVVLDEWPWLKPYIEIEGSSEPAIQAAAAKLGFDWQDASFGSVDTAYRAQYPRMTAQDTVGAIAEVRFGASLPDYLKERQ